MIIVGLLVSSALMARVDHTVATIGFVLSGAIGLYWLWKDHPDTGRVVEAGRSGAVANGEERTKAPPLP